MNSRWKHIAVALAACLGVIGCGESPLPQPADFLAEPVATNTPAPIQAAPTAVAKEEKPDPMIGVYEAAMLNPATNQPQPLHLELKTENKFTAYPDNEANNKLHGIWKIEGAFLICTGDTEATKQSMTLKIDATSLNLISIGQKDVVMPLDQITPPGAKGIVFKKKP